MATCVELALLDRATKVAVLRGGPVESENTGAGEFSGPELISTTSTGGGFPISGISNATWVTSTRSIGDSQTRTLPYGQKIETVEKTVN